jgi:hypothetical protein
MINWLNPLAPPNPLNPLQDALNPFAPQEPERNIFQRGMDFMGNLFNQGRDAVADNLQNVNTTVQFGAEGFNQQNKNIGARSSYSAEEQEVLRQYQNSPQFAEIQSKLSGLDAVCGPAFSSVATINIFDNFGDVLENPTMAGLRHVLGKAGSELREGFAKLMQGDFGGAMQEFGQAFREASRLITDRDGIAKEILEERTRNLYADLTQNQPDGANFSPRMAYLITEQVYQQGLEQANLPAERTTQLAELLNDPSLQVANAPVQPAFTGLSDTVNQLANTVQQPAHGPAAPASAQPQNPLEQLGNVAQSFLSNLTAMMSGESNQPATVAETPNARPADQLANRIP